MEHNYCLGRIMPKNEPLDMPALTPTLQIDNNNLKLLVKAPEALIDNAPQIHCFQITLNLPQTQEYLKICFHDQTRKLLGLFRKILLKIRELYNCNPIRYKYVFENSKTFVPHMHSLIYVKFNDKYIIDSFIMDIAKIAHLYTVKSKYYNNNYYPCYLRFKSPLILIQYYDNTKTPIENGERDFENYMLKENDSTTNGIQKV